MEFEFETRRPDPPLEPFVESVWFARGHIPYRQERIGPTGSTVAVVVLGSPIVQTPRNGAGTPFVAAEGWLAGPHDGPVINAPTAETLAVGIVTTPFGCRALFGVDPSPLRGRVVDLPGVWPAAGPLRTALLGAVLDGIAPFSCLDAVEATLLAGLQADVPGWERCAAAVAALEGDPRRRISDVAEEMGISHAHLDREFTRVVGLTPRSLARILRLRRLLADVDVHAPITWTDLAAEWGWFDQSHFIRDFKRHTGVTPSGYVAAQRAVFDVGQQAPGFVPET
ncbi:MAG TPA: AraC family transcriptional regulator [Acidimicrobiales bacterium]|nr:AraC family transcriptional regulator [Acidimicrobiales bacterium]